MAAANASLGDLRTWTHHLQVTLKPSTRLKPVWRTHTHAENVKQSQRNGKGFLYVKRDVTVLCGYFRSQAKWREQHGSLKSSATSCHFSTVQLDFFEIQDPFYTQEQFKVSKLKKAINEFIYIPNPTNKMSWLKYRVEYWGIWKLY